MTPLEEIEEAIHFVRGSTSTPFDNVKLLGPLYQARAIERLEATVRDLVVEVERIAECVAVVHTNHDETTVFNTWDNSR